MLSLQQRLGSGLLISLTLVFGALWFITQSAIQHLAEEYIVSRLNHDSESLLGALQWPAAGAAPVLSREDAPIYQQPFSGHYYRIQTPQALLRSRSLWDQDLAIDPLAPGVQQRFYRDGPQGQVLLVLVRGYRKQDTELTIAIAEDFTPLEAEIDSFQRYFALTAATALLLLIVLQVLSLRSGLRPLHRIRAELQALEQGQRQLLDTEAPAEIAPLVEEINQLVNSNIARLKRSRHAMADLAHALKRPLTVIQQHLQEHAAELPAGFGDTARRQVQEMRESIEHILQRATLAGGGPAAARFDPRTDVQDLIGSLLQLHADKPLRIEYTPVIPHAVAYDRQDLLELLGNLLDNACKWARGRVRLVVEEAPGLRIRVADDGPGVAEADRDPLLQRGKRLDEGREGQGLGLAIVKDIVEQYAGELRLTRSAELGGLCVEVQFDPGVKTRTPFTDT